MIDFWEVFGSGVFFGFGLGGAVFWMVPHAIESWRERRRDPEVIDLATARLRKKLKDDFNSRRGGR